MANAGWNDVGVHAPGTDAKEIEAAIKANGIEYSVLLGNETKGVGVQPDRITGYPIKMFPICVLIDKDGNIEAVGSLQSLLGQ